MLITQKKVDTVKETVNGLSTDETLKVERRLDGQLWAGRNGDATAVQVTRCFPWSQPDRFISLRDDDEKEVALISQLSDLDKESRLSVEGALIEAGFVMQIEKVLSVNEDFEIRHWKVLTRQGDRSFQTKLDDWPIKLPGGGFLFRDVPGDLFFIDDVENLDEETQKHLWAYIG